MALPSIQSAAAATLGEVRAANGELHSLLAGGTSIVRRDPITPRIGRGGAYAHLGVGIALDMTSMVTALANTEAYSAAFPGTFLKGMKGNLRADIQEHTPEGPYRDYDDPHAKQHGEAFYGLGGSDEARERRELSGIEAVVERNEEELKTQIREISKFTQEMARRGRLGAGHELMQIRIEGKSLFSTRGGELTMAQADAIFAFAERSAESQLKAGTERKGKMFETKFKGDPSGALYDSIEVITTAVMGGAYIHATSLVYYAWFVEKGAARALTPVLASNWTDRDKMFHQEVDTALPVSRLGGYDYWETMEKMREDAYRKSGHIKFAAELAYDAQGRQWIGFQERNNGSNEGHHMFEKGLGTFMDRHAGNRMTREFTRGFRQVFDGDLGPREALRRLGGIEVAPRRIMTKTGRTQLRNPSSGAIARARVGAVDVERPA